MVILTDRRAQGGGWEQRRFRRTACFVSRRDWFHKLVDLSRSISEFIYILYYIGSEMIVVVVVVVSSTSHKI